MAAESRAGASAQSGADEDHASAFEHLTDFLHRFVSGRETHFRITSCAKPARGPASQLNLLPRDRTGERLHVRVHGDNLHVANAVQKEPIEHIRTRSAEPNDLDSEIHSGSGIRLAMQFNHDGQRLPESEESREFFSKL